MTILDRVAAAFGSPPRESRSRDAGNFTERQLSAFETSASGTDAVATGVSAVETAAGFYGRDLALAEVTPRNSRTMSITPSWLMLAGRELARCGSFRCDIQVVRGNVVLVPASSAFAVQGTSDPSSWVWIITLFGPGDTITKYRTNDGVLNLTLGSSVTRPWEGCPPWKAATMSGGLLSGIERQLIRGSEVAIWLRPPGARPWATVGKVRTLTAKPIRSLLSGETLPRLKVGRCSRHQCLLVSVVDPVSRHPRQTSTWRVDSARILPSR